MLDEAAIAADELRPNTLPAARPPGGRDHRDIPAGEVHWLVVTTRPVLYSMFARAEMYRLY